MIEEDCINTEAETRILIVDDEVNTLSLLKMALGRRYRVDTASDIADSLDLLEQFQYSLLIVDLCLGNESGITLAKYIHDREIPTEVIIITGYSSVQSVVEAVELGVTHYLSKPIDISELDSLVEQALHTRTFTHATELCANSPDAPLTEVQSHLREVLGLYSLLLKLSRTTSIRQTVKIFLSSILKDLHADLAVLGVSFAGSYHLYTMGAYDDATTPQLLLDNWSKGAMEKSGLSKNSFKQGEFSLEKFDDESVSSEGKGFSKSVITPLANFGETFGFVGLYGDSVDADGALGDLFYTLIPVVAPIIYRGILEEKIKRQAKTDGLTGIANRRMLEETLYRYIQQVIRYNRDISIVMMDIDNFKSVNDKYGHLVGDNVLKDLVSCVNKIIRGSDLFARYGGEEFVLVLPDTDIVGSYNLAERIRKEIDSSEFSDGEVTFNYTVSFGVSSFKHTECDRLDDSEHQYTIKLVESLLLNADDALYKAKRTGKNKVVVSKSGDNKESE